MSDGQRRQPANPQPQEEIGFEGALQRLEEIVAELEQGTSSLDRSLKLYEEGIQTYRTCSRLLHEAEGKVAKLVETLEGELKEEALEPPRADTAQAEKSG
jgi:exodeoxyribonuclease VII small subunit